MPKSVGSVVKSVVVVLSRFQFEFQIRLHWVLSRFTYSKTALTECQKNVSTVGFYKLLLFYRT